MDVGGNAQIKKILKIMTINIRRATTTADFAAAHQLIYELAVFENAAHEVLLSLEDFIRDGSGEKPLFFCNVAELKNADNSAEIVGMSLFYFSYSTWKGKILYLDDLVVTKTYRRIGVGKKLVQAIFNFARENKVNQVRWHVLDWNTPAIKFYKKLGMKLEDDWITCKLDKSALTNMQA